MKDEQEMGKMPLTIMFRCADECQQYGHTRVMVLRPCTPRFACDVTSPLLTVAAPGKKTTLFFFFFFAKITKEEEDVNTCVCTGEPPSLRALPTAGEVGTVNKPCSWQICADTIAHEWRGSRNQGRNKIDNKQGERSAVNKQHIFPSAERAAWLEAVSVCSLAPNRITNSFQMLPSPTFSGIPALHRCLSMRGVCL